MILRARTNEKAEERTGTHARTPCAYQMESESQSGYRGGKLPWTTARILLLISFLGRLRGASQLCVCLYAARDRMKEEGGKNKSLPRSSEKSSKYVQRHTRVSLFTANRGGWGLHELLSNFRCAFQNSLPRAETRAKWRTNDKEVAGEPVEKGSDTAEREPPADGRG